jgi:uncharacterized protein (TIGR03435 family)
MRRVRVVVATVAVSVVLSAQSEPARFEVASVKVNKSGPTGGRAPVVAGDRLTIVNMTLRAIVQTAYGIGRDDIAGAPRWMDVDHFDIVAKAEKPVSADEMRLLLRNLLADRFTLVTHTEKKTTPVYALVLARADGRLGPNLRPATRDCASLRADPPGRDPDPCGMLTSVTASVTGRMAVRGFDLSMLGRLAAEVERPIVDRTGLKGIFDWELTWTPQNPRLRTPVQSATVDPNGPSIFTALQEQLGLKLESQQDERDVLVIDKVEQPTEN